MSEFENTARDDAPGPGAIISYAREQLGISVEDLATELKLSQHKLRLIENNQFEQVGTPTFVRGYLRNASRVLQLDIAMLLEEYDAYQGHESSSSVESPEPEIVKSKRSSNKFLWLLMWLLPVILAVILSVWFFTGSSAQPESSGDAEQSSAELKTDPIKSDIAKEFAQGQSQESLLQGTLPAQERNDSDDNNVEENVEENGEEKREESDRNSLKLDVEANSATSTLGISEVKNAQEIARLSSEKIDSQAETSETGLSGNAPVNGSQTSAAQQVGVNAQDEPSQVLAEGEKQLTFDFNDSCWLQVRDATGKRLYSNTKAAGQQLRLKGVAPFRINIGNVRAVSLTVDGEAYPLQARAGRKTLALTIL